jgi:hypothetical protein
MMWPIIYCGAKPSTIINNLFILLISFFATWTCSSRRRIDLSFMWYQTEKISYIKLNTQHKNALGHQNQYRQFFFQRRCYTYSPSFSPVIVLNAGNRIKNLLRDYCIYLYKSVCVGARVRVCMRVRSFHYL